MAIDKFSIRYHDDIARIVAQTIDMCRDSIETSVKEDCKSTLEYIKTEIYDIIKESDLSIISDEKWTFEDWLERLALTDGEKEAIAQIKVWDFKFRGKQINGRQAYKSEITNNAKYFFAIQHFSKKQCDDEDWRLILYDDPEHNYNIYDCRCSTCRKRQALRVFENNFYNNAFRYAIRLYETRWNEDWLFFDEELILYCSFAYLYICLKNELEYIDKELAFRCCKTTVKRHKNGCNTAFNSIETTYTKEQLTKLSKALKKAGYFDKDFNIDRWLQLWGKNETLTDNKGVIAWHGEITKLAALVGHITRASEGIKWSIAASYFSINDQQAKPTSLKTSYNRIATIPKDDMPRTTKEFIKLIEAALAQ